MTTTLDLDDRLTSFREKRCVGISAQMLIGDLAASGRSHDAQQVIRDAFEFDRGTAAHQIGFLFDPGDAELPPAELWDTVGQASGIPGAWEEAWPQLCQLALETSSRSDIRLIASTELLSLERRPDQGRRLSLLYTAAAWGHVEAALTLGHHYREHGQPLAAASWFCRAAEIDSSLFDDCIGGWIEYDVDDLPWTLEAGWRDARLLGELIISASPEDAQQIARLATDKQRSRLPPLPEYVEAMPGGYPPPEGVPLLAP